MVRLVWVALVMAWAALGARAQVAGGGGADAPTRVAVLNFGPPGDAVQDGDLIGVNITAQMFKDVVPLLEKDGVQVVVVRVNSGGGCIQEVQPLQEVFEKEYKPRFRTVVWIEQAISTAAMSVWGVPEMYCTPTAALGAATLWGGLRRPFSVEEMLVLMERVSERGGRDPKIMRSMQITEPLSVNVDPATGGVTWHQDCSGEKILNPPDQILTLNAADTVRFKVARAIAADRDTLAFAMGIERVEWAGREASETLDQARKDADAAYKAAIEDVVAYIRLIQSMDRDRNQEDRRARVERARKRIAAVEKAVRTRPNLRLCLAGYVGRELDQEFFDIEHNRLMDLERERVVSAEPVKLSAAPVEWRKWMAWPKSEKKAPAPTRVTPIPTAAAKKRIFP